ncbi:site-specific integrase [Nocardia terpenica]|uniref:site-specific integrase n=1 Tax=Nocardia terpenica TaxID=455432 RepID=UPI001E3D0A5D|nr:site-specific integrase [Nocardia terpenica]
MLDETTPLRDLAGVRLPLIGSLVVTESKWEPYRLLDPVDDPVGPAAVSFGDLLAAGRSAATVRSYGMDLLRWFRFLWVVEVSWDRATRVEARDFCRWLAVTGRDGKPYSVSVRAHSETVLRGFYDYHRDVGTGPLLNPFPLDRSRRGGRAHAHHDPMEPYCTEKIGLYRPRLPRRIPRAIPDRQFNEIFARLPSNRDRALVVFYVSTGARASELLSATRAEWIRDGS